MIRLPNFPVYKQITPRTCGFSSIAMVSSYLDKEIKENEIPHSYFYKKIKQLLCFDFRNTIENHLPDHFVKHITPKRDQIIDIITKQLRNNLPIPVLYSTPNIYKNGKVGLHYAVVVGIDRNNVIIANPFGYEEILDITDFLNKMSFKNFNNKPLKIKLGMWLKLIKPNSLFYITMNK